ncbi:hypothetical protein V8E53_012620 [Lactarius tabidus]
MVQTEANFREYQLQAIDDEIKSLEGSIRALRSRRNTLAPVSSLPTEVLTAIFALLHEPVASSPLTLPEEEPDHLQWIRVAHVCHHWREIALNQPLFWSHVDFATFTSAGAAEILARANMVPLTLEARVPIGLWNDARFSAFQNELQAHVSHTRHLDISAEPLHLRKTLEGLITPAPRLEYLSLSSEEINNRSTETRVFIPDNIFGGATPRLSGLVLRNCKLSWKSPLLRGLKHLDIRSPFDRPGLSAWLDMLIEMPQLITLTLHEATPVLPHDASLSSDFERIVTLPSVAHNKLFFRRRCLRLAKILPFVSRHAHTLQHTQPLQSMLVRSDDAGVDMFAWTAPDMVIESINLVSFPNTEVSAPLVFSFTGGYGIWTYIDVFDAAMATLPLDSLVTLISQGPTSALQKEVWFHHAPRWPLLQCVRLSPSAGRGFTEMLLEDNGGRESPLLPSLTKLILVDTDLSPRRTFRLCDALMKRVEQGAPLETLDLHTCVATSRAVDLLSQIVVDVLGPEKTVDEREETIYMWHSAARGLIEYGYASSENDRERDYDNPDSDEEVRANVDSDAKIWDNEHTDDSEDDDAWYLWK